ncbi:cilia- and flagella-associated protein 157-like [Echeneis naucrates]|uniref:cilia- and flagella-associated protein 157-like n=1 Tax=Echeneis naucrates TaxID=173247 RepID=UPI00111454FB|nr:cilia- and flagella-associated protein 157 [Echeneis naucrates]
MPKKKENKSSNKQDEVKKTQERETSGDKNGSDAKEKDLYLIQIRYLTEQLERYQLKCDDLERQKTDMTHQHSVLEKDKMDIVEYLKRSLLEKEDEVEELSEHLENQRQAADKDRDALQLQHNQLKQELQDQIEELSKENATLVARLGSLEEFENQRDELMSNMESLEKQLLMKEEEHKADIHSLEMKQLLEKRRLEKEMESHMAAMAAEVQQLADQKIPETTRAALLENAEVRAQLSQMSEQAQVLMKENSALQDRKTQLRMDVEILENMLSEMSRKSCFRKKAAEQLTEKCQQLQEELKVCRQEHQQLQDKHRGTLAEMDALRKDRASLSDQGSKNRAEASRLAAELQRERRKRSRMKSIMQEAAVALRQALMEDPAGQDFGPGQLKPLMQKLLVALDRPALTDKPNELQTSDPPAAGAVSLDPVSSLQFQLARYRPGDLGLVPPPAPKHILPRAGPGSVLPLYRKPFGPRTSNSVNPTDSAARRLTFKHSVTKLK